MVGRGVSDAGLDGTRRQLQWARREAEDAMQDARFHVAAARVRLDDARAGLADLQDFYHAADAAARLLWSLVVEASQAPVDAWEEARRAQAVEADFVRRFEQDAGAPFRH